MCQDTSDRLLIFSDDSKFTGTIKDLLDVLMKSVYYLNTNQTAVIGFDQSIMVEKTQWLPPTAYSQYNFVLMVGALYNNMVMLSCSPNNCINVFEHSKEKGCTLGFVE